MASSKSKDFFQISIVFPLLHSFCLEEIRKEEGTLGILPYQNDLQTKNFSLWSNIKHKKNKRNQNTKKLADMTQP